MLGHSLVLPCEQDPGHGQLQEKVANPGLIEDVAPHSLGEGLLHRDSMVNVPQGILKGSMECARAALVPAPLCACQFHDRSGSVSLHV